MRAEWNALQKSFGVLLSSKTRLIQHVTKSDGGTLYQLRAAGFANIAVSFGYTDIPPHQLGADLVIDHFDDLIEALDRVTGD